MKPDKNKEGVFDDDPKGKTEGAAFGAPLGAIAGGIVGSVAGPGGTVAGAVGGAAAGAALGHAVGAGGSADDSYWRKELRQQPYFDPAYDFEDYAAALRLGHEARRAAGDGSFEEHEARLREEWERLKGNCRLTWGQARHAVQGAWERAGRSPGPAV